MRLFEIIAEARKNPTINNQRNGPPALFNYLRTMDNDTLSRSFIHFSNVEKLGIRPTGGSSWQPLEPIGIFSYPAKEWLDNYGEVEYAGSYPIAHVITIKKSHFTKYSEGPWPQQPEKLYDKMAAMYPEHAQNPKVNYRIKTTAYLIKQGYNLIDTNVASPAEVVILNIKAIEKVKMIIMQYARPDEVSGIDADEGEYYWAGPSAYITMQDRRNYDKKIEDRKILSRDEEYFLLYNSPDLHQKYIKTVLTPQGLQSKFPAAEIAAIIKKQKARAKRIPDFRDPSPTPNYEAMLRLFNYGKKLVNQGRQLSKTQEAALVTFGTGGEFRWIEHDEIVRYLAKEYYKLLADNGLNRLLTSAEISNAQQNSIGRDGRLRKRWPWDPL